MRWLNLGRSKVKVSGGGMRCTERPSSYLYTLQVGVHLTVFFAGWWEWVIFQASYWEPCQEAEGETRWTWQFDYSRNHKWSSSHKMCHYTTHSWWQIAGVLLKCNVNVTDRWFLIMLVNNHKIYYQFFFLSLLYFWTIIVLSFRVMCISQANYGT